MILLLAGTQACGMRRWFGFGQKQVEPPKIIDSKSREELIEELDIEIDDFPEEKKIEEKIDDSDEDIFIDDEFLEKKQKAFIEKTNKDTYKFLIEAEKKHIKKFTDELRKLGQEVQKKITPNESFFNGALEKRVKISNTFKNIFSKLNHYLYNLNINVDEELKDLLKKLKDENNFLSSKFAEKIEKKEGSFSRKSIEINKDLNNTIKDFFDDAKYLKANRALKDFKRERDHYYSGAKEVYKDMSSEEEKLKKAFTYNQDFYKNLPLVRLKEIRDKKFIEDKDRIDRLFVDTVIIAHQIKEKMEEIQELKQEKEFLRFSTEISNLKKDYMSFVETFKNLIVGKKEKDTFVHYMKQQLRDVLWPLFMTLIRHINSGFESSQRNKFKKIVQGLEIVE